MRKIFIWSLAIVSFIAITALIFIQLIWVQDAYDVEKQQFDLMVNKSLGQVVTRLENIETVETFNQIRNDLAKSGDTTLLKELALPDHMPVDNIMPDIQNGIVDQSGFNLENLDPANPQTKIDLISGDSLVFLRENSLYLNDQSTALASSIISRTDFETNYKRLLANKKIYIEKVFSQIVRNEGRIEDRLSYQVLDSSLRMEFSDKNILIPYEFAVRTGNARYTLKSPGFNANINHQKYSALLFPHDVKTTPNFIVLFFPDRKDYLIKSVGIMATASLTLAMIILIISFIAIYVIFKQKKLSEIKNDFINNMTHELKTPISTISLASQLLADQTLSPDAKNIGYISSLIQEESKRLGNQVERVLQVSIFEEGSMTLKFEQINLNRLVNQAVDKISIQVNQQNGRLNLDLDQEPILVEGDEVHLTNVIVNLLDNAIKYCKTEPDIRIKTSRVKSEVLLEIADNGIGISKEHQKKVFEKFYRVPTGNVHDVKGFGIGLSYVRRVVDQHHGKIEIESEPGKGTIFRVYLPVKQKRQT